jgi:M-phase inducer tyrosine phosphatase
MSPAELAGLLATRRGSVVVVDARFQYEYTGGHIHGGMNIRLFAEMTALFQEFQDANPFVVFHCEFSSERGPTLMRRFREYDRSVNKERYPALSDQHVFLLEGGYHQFHKEFPLLCDGGYIGMYDPHFVKTEDLQRSNDAFKGQWKRGC